ncbi:MAG: hypothetical protein AAFN70_00975, partial [Planctomycetota bacterium]
MLAQSPASPPAAGFNSTATSKTRPAVHTASIAAAQTLRLPKTRQRRSPVVTAIAVDPSGSLLAVAGDDHVIHLLDQRTLRIRESLHQHEDWVRTITFDSSGYHMASGGDGGRLFLWNRKGDRFVVNQVLAGAPSLYCVCHSPDRRQLAAVGFEAELFLFGTDNHQRLALHC